MFKEVFKKLRKEKHLTQSELAAALGISRSAISMYENGEREPDLETLEAIADYFNIDMNQLTGQEKYLSKDSIAYRIQTIMTYQHVSLDELASRLDVDKDSLYDFIYKTPDSDFHDDSRLQGIADALEVKTLTPFGDTTCLPATALKTTLVFYFIRLIRTFR